MRILALLLAIALPAGAATVTLSGTSPSCAYTSASGDSAGNFTFACQSGPIPPVCPGSPGCPPPPPTCPGDPSCPPVTPPGCSPSGIQPQFAWNTLEARQSSGVIYAYPIPEPQFGGVVTFTQGQQPNTPPGVFTEFYVSTCAGKIDPTAGACYYSSTFVNNNVLNVHRAGGPAYVCQAPSGQQWYINVRWTYSSCPFGSCGFSLQWVSNW